MMAPFPEGNEKGDPSMARSKNLALAAVLALGMGLSAHAGGLAHRGTSPTSRIAMRQTHRTPDALRFRRFSPSMDDPARNPISRRGKGFRPQVGQYGGRSLLQRGMGEAFGYQSRDGIVLGLGRRARSQYDTPRDQRIAEGRGRRIGYYGTRIPQGLRRIFSP